MTIKLSGYFLFIVFMISGFAVQAAGLDDADERLFKVQKSMAEKGNTRAQYYLGEMHEHGLGTQPDLNEAFKWYAKAAEQGDPLAKRKMSSREEIFNEAKKEREAEKLKNSAPEPKPVVTKPAASAPKKAAPAPTPAPVVAKSDQAAQNEQEKTREAAEREKRRAKVRAMIREYLKNPTATDPFE